jgi:hypothetical protein
MHTSGGYLTYVTYSHKVVFDYRPGDVYACMADCGWITGHSYILCVHSPRPPPTHYIPSDRWLGCMARRCRCGVVELATSRVMLRVVQECGATEICRGEDVGRVPRLFPITVYRCSV